MLKEKSDEILRMCHRLTVEISKAQAKLVEFTGKKSRLESAYRDWIATAQGDPKKLFQDVKELKQYIDSYERQLLTLANVGIENGPQYLEFS